MALLSFRNQDRILVGADLKYVDAIVCVGTIENRLLTQAVGRTVDLSGHGINFSVCFLDKAVV